MGAMENKGLNIFNTKYVLASPATATDDDFAGIESVVGHEYFHNWTGNRITCRDWFQLAEGRPHGLPRPGVQRWTWPAARRRARCAASSDVRTLRAAQFPEDAGPMAHPVRPDSYAEINNFYTATVYEKGAEVVRMMHTLVGREGFRRGMDLYFQRHDGQAVTCDDFAQAIADANPAARWPATWTPSSAGTRRPARRACRPAAATTPPPARYTLTLRQSAEPSPGQPDKQPFVIPVAMGLLAPTARRCRCSWKAKPRRAAPSAAGADRGRADLHLRQHRRRRRCPRCCAASRRRCAGRRPGRRRAAGAAAARPRRLQPLGGRPAPGLGRLLAALPGERTPTRWTTPTCRPCAELLRDPALDPAFKDLVLMLPSEAYVAEQRGKRRRPAAHPRRARADAPAAGRRLHATGLWAWDAHQVREGYQPPPTGGPRALANLACACWCCTPCPGRPVWPGRAYQRFKDAGNMTDRLGALVALVDAQSPLAEPALARFHARSAGDALVIDKWFNLQATAPEPLGQRRRLQRAREALLQHPDFSLRNPNRARSLLSGFCRDNPAAFHRTDAAGYVFWADKVLELDAINPQLAAAWPAPWTAGAAGRALAQRRARGHRPRGRQARPQRRRARDRHQGPRLLNCPSPTAP
jgi:aminopeptidase N